MLSQLRAAAVLLAVLTAVVGLLYPVAITAVAQAIFPNKASGSLVTRDGVVIGSSLIGQNFADPRYFHGRPSATSPAPYNAAASGATNLAPTNPALIERVTASVEALKAEANGAAVPMDLVTTSGSGLDPHISPEAAQFQVARVAAARSLPAERLRDLVNAHVESRTLGVLGEPVVNVLALNLALDDLS